jgi:hypothetical protein
VARGGVFQELLPLTDEAGAKSIILQNRQRVAEFASVFPARLLSRRGWTFAETPFAELLVRSPWNAGAEPHSRTSFNVGYEENSSCSQHSCFGTGRQLRVKEIFSSAEILTGCNGLWA